MAEKESIPDIHLGNAAQFIAHRMRVEGAVIVTLNENGSFGFTGYGVTHAKANEMLSVGIHINLTQMEEAIRAGKAGDEAQDFQERLDKGEA